MEEGVLIEGGDEIIYPQKIWVGCRQGIYYSPYGRFENKKEPLYEESLGSPYKVNICENKNGSSLG